MLEFYYSTIYLGSISDEHLEIGEKILKKIGELLRGEHLELDGKFLLKYSYKFYKYIPTTATVPVYIANENEIYHKSQTLKVEKV